VADFIVEFTKPDTGEADNEDMVGPIPLNDQKAAPDSGWVLYVDGSSNVRGAGAGVVLITPDSTTVQYALRLGFKASNNETEYKALLAGLRLAVSLGVQSLQVRCDSQLVVNHISTEYEAKETRMIAYLDEAKKLIEKFENCTIHQIPRAENSWADALAKLGSSVENKVPQTIPIEFIEQPSIGTEKEVNQVRASPSWMDPIFNYLTAGEISSDKLEARRLRVRAARYIVLNSILYKKGHSQPYLRCLRNDEVEYVMQEIHEEICGNHSGSRALTLKILRQGYFWPTIKEDSKEYVRKCDKCQRFAAVSKQLAEEMTPMSGPWSFAQWGIDIIGPLPMGKG
jgi:ribonuclease HI